MSENPINIIPSDYAQNEKAAAILKQLEGLNMAEAIELLEDCKTLLERVKVRF